MKPLSLILAVGLVALSHSIAQVPDAPEPLKVVGKLGILDPSGHHIVVTDEKGQTTILVYDHSTTFLNELGEAVAVESIKAGIPVMVFYSDINVPGRLLATKLVLLPLPIPTASKAPANPPSNPPAKP